MPEQPEKDEFSQYEATPQEKPQDEFSQYEVKPPEPPGVVERYATRLGQSVGAPTSKEELKALKLQQESPMGFVEGAFPAVKVGHMALDYGKGLWQSGKNVIQEGKEAGENIAAGQPFWPNAGKVVQSAGEETVRSIPFIGPPIVRAKEDVEQHNYAGALGGATGVALQLLAPKIIKEAPRAIKGAAEAAPWSNASRLERAATDFTKVLGDKEINKTVPDAISVGNPGETTPKPGVLHPEAIKKTFKAAAPHLSATLQESRKFFDPKTFTSTDFHVLLDTTQDRLNAQLDRFGGEAGPNNEAWDRLSEGDRKAYIDLANARESVETLQDLLANPENVKAIENGVDRTGWGMAKAASKMALPIAVGGHFGMIPALGGLLYDMAFGDVQGAAKAFMPSPSQYLGKAMKKAGKTAPAEYRAYVPPEGGAPTVVPPAVTIGPNPAAPEGGAPAAVPPPVTPPAGRLVTNPSELRQVAKTLRPGLAEQFGVKAPEARAPLPPAEPGKPIYPLPKAEMPPAAATPPGAASQTPVAPKLAPGYRKGVVRPPLAEGHTPVESSAMWSYKADPDAGTMEFHLKNHGDTIYRHDAAPDDFKAFDAAESKGKWMNAFAKNNKPLEASYDGGQTWVKQARTDVGEKVENQKVISMAPKKPPEAGRSEASARAEQIRSKGKEAAPQKYDAGKFNEDGFIMLPDFIGKAGDYVRSLFEKKPNVAGGEKLLGDLKAHSGWNHEHSVAVGELSAQIGQWMGLPKAEVENLRRGGALHDIGKLKIGQSTLENPGRPSPEQVEEIHTHPEAARKLLQPLHDRAAMEMATGHHLEPGGKGYPGNVSGKENIPLRARIAAVADTFNAIVSDRPYQKGRSVEEAIRVLRKNAGGQFDPDIVSVFASAIEGKQEAAKLPPAGAMTAEQYRAFKEKLHGPEAVKMYVDRQFAKMTPEQREETLSVKHVEPTPVKVRNPNQLHAPTIWPEKPNVKPEGLSLSREGVAELRKMGYSSEAIGKMGRAEMLRLLGLNPPKK